MTERQNPEEYKQEFESTKQELADSYNELKTNPASRNPMGYERLFGAVCDIYNMNGLDMPNGRKILKEVGEVDPIRQALADFIKSSCEAEDLGKIYLGVNIAKAFGYEKNSTWRDTLAVITRKAQQLELDRASAEVRRRAEYESRRAREEADRLAEELRENLRKQAEEARQKREQAEEVRRQAQAEAVRQSEELHQRRQKEAEEARKRARNEQRRRQEEADKQKEKVNPEAKKTWDDAKSKFNREYSQIPLRELVEMENRFSASMGIIQEMIVGNGDVSELFVRSAFENLITKVWPTLKENDVTSFFRPKVDSLTFANANFLPVKFRNLTALNSRQKAQARSIYTRLNLALHSDLENNNKDLPILTDKKLEKLVPVILSQLNVSYHLFKKHYGLR